MPSMNQIITMNESDAERYILELLSGCGPLTTMEIEKETAQRGKQCPDQTVQFLSRMRAKGLICGVVSLERGGWLWYPI